MKFYRLILCLALVSSFAFGEDTYRFQWTGVEGDPTSILQMGALRTAEEVIAAINQDKSLATSVIVLDFIPPTTEDRKDNLLSLNSKEHAAAVRFYTDHAAEVGGDLNFGGVFMEPFQGSDLLDRPLRDKPIILIPKNSRREYILHEATHALIDVLRNQSPVTIQGVKYSAREARRMEAADFQEAVKKIMEAESAGVYDKLSSEEHNKKLIRNYRNMISLFQGALNVMSDFHGDELDVTRFLTEHEKELNLTSEEALHNFKYFEVTFSSVEKLINESVDNYKEFRDKVYSSMPPAVQKSFDTFAIHLLQKIHILEDHREFYFKHRPRFYKD